MRAQCASLAVMALLLATVLSSDEQGELGNGRVGEAKERPYDDKVPGSQTLAKNPKLWKAAQKGEVEKLMRHLAKVKHSGTLPMTSHMKKLKGLVKAAKMMQKVKKLRAHVKRKVARKVDRAKKKIRKALKKVTPKSPSAVKKSVECSLLREENAALQTTKELLTYKNAQVTVDRNQFKRSSKYLTLQNSKLRKKISNLKIATAKQGKLFSGNMKIIADNTRLAAENNVLAKQKSNLQKSVSTKMGIIAKQESSIATLKETLLDKDMAIKKNHRDIASAQKQLSAAKANTAKLEASLKSTQAALAAQKVANAQLQRQNAGLQNNIKAAAKSYAKQGAALSHQTVLYKSLTDRNQKLQSQVGALMTTVRRGKTRILKLEVETREAVKAAAQSSASTKAEAASTAAAMRKVAAAKKATSQALAVRNALQKVKKKVRPFDILRCPYTRPNTDTLDSL